MDRSERGVVRFGGGLGFADRCIVQLPYIFLVVRADHALIFVVEIVGQNRIDADQSGGKKQQNRCRDHKDSF